MSRALGLNDHPPRLVLNGVGMFKRPEIAAAEFAKAVETGPTAVIPHDAKLFGAAANNGQMIAEIEAERQNRRDLRRSRLGARGPSTDAAQARRGVLDPLIAKLGRKRR